MCSSTEPRKSKTNLSPPVEVDFDDNPTQLYRLIEKRKTTQAIDHCINCPEEAATWIVKKDGSNIRWRILPIHIAMMTRAADELVKALLNAYPESVKEPDDQGMIPLHLAFRHSARESIINQLLDAFPDGIDVKTKDTKGKTPLEMIASNKDFAPANKSNHLRMLTAELYEYRKNSHLIKSGKVDSEDTELIESLKYQLKEEKRKNEVLKSSQNRESDVWKASIEDLEITIKNKELDHERVIAMYEKRKNLHDKEKSFLVKQLQDTEDENKTILESFHEAKERHEDKLKMKSEKQQNIRKENTEMKKKNEELLTAMNMISTVCAEEAENSSDEDKKTSGNSFDCKKIYDDVSNIIKNLKEKMNESKAKCEELHITLESERMEHLMASNSLDNMKKSLEECQNKQEESSRKLETMTLIKEDLMKSITDLEDKLSTTKSENSTLESSLENQGKEFRSEIQNLKQEKEVLEIKLKTFEHKMNDMQNTIDKMSSFESSLYEKEKELTEINEKMKVTYGEKDNLEKNLQIEINKSNNFSSVIDNLKTKVEESREQITSQRSLYKVEKQETSQIIEVLQAQITDLNKENEKKAKKMLEMQRNFIDRKATEDKEIAEKIEQLEADYAASSKTNRELHRKLVDLLSNCDELRKAFELERDDDYKLIDNLRLKLHESEKEVRNYKNEIIEMKRKLDKSKQ